MTLTNVSFNATCIVLRFLDSLSLSRLLRVGKGPAKSVDGQIFPLVLLVAKARVVSILELSDSSAWLLGPDPLKSLEDAKGGDPSIASAPEDGIEILSTVHHAPQIIDQFSSIHVKSMPLRRGGLCNWVEALDELESWQHMRATSKACGITFASDFALWEAHSQLRDKEDLMAQTFPRFSL